MEKRKEGRIRGWIETGKEFHGGKNEEKGGKSRKRENLQLRIGMYH